MAGASAASDQAFANALSESRLQLTSFARRLSRDREAAEDLVQETLLRAWAARERFEPGTNFRAWTHKILQNLFLSQRRRARFVGDFDEADAERRSAKAETQTTVAELNTIVDLLLQIPATQQHALRMIAFEDLTYEEAAFQTGVAVSTIKTRVHRGREALKALVNGERQARPAPQETGQEEHTPLIGEALKLNAGQKRGAWAAAKAAGLPYLIGRSPEQPS